MPMLTDLLLVPMGVRYTEMRAAAVAAEAAGFDGVWTWDHLRDTDGSPVGVPECLTVLSALAEATSRISLGSLVLNVATRHPALVANIAATIQQVSDGRLLLGLGAGSGPELAYAQEYRMIGLPLDTARVRAGRVAEAAQVLRQLWAGEHGSFQGEHYQLVNPAGFLPAASPPPIIIAGFGPRMARLAGTHGDGFNTLASHPRMEELVQTARDAYAATDHDPAGFIVTLFAGLSERWLRRDSPDRTRLERLGVARLILSVQPPYDPAQIREAGARLGRGG